jgi:PhnB protein
MTGSIAPAPYIHFPGTAREALTFYGDVFGCAVELHTFGDFNRTDGPADAIAHGYLTNGPVLLFGSDAAGSEPPVQCAGMMFSMLGAARPAILKDWFSRLSEGGQVLDDLQVRPWGAWDGRVVDRYGLPWLIGFEDADSD